LCSGVDRDLVSLDRAGTRIDEDLAFSAQTVPDPAQMRRLAGCEEGHRIRGLGPGRNVLILTLVAGLAAVALAAVGVGTLVDNVSHGDGVAALDHPVAIFIAAHRAAALTWVMRVVSVVGGPAAMAGLALAAGLVLGVVWRWWAPAVVLAVTAVGVTGLTIVFKIALGRGAPR
jgi:hypothetical protein